jgi:putative restriction endonuclease
MFDSELDNSIRLNSFNWLNEQIEILGEDVLPRTLLEKGFLFKNEQIHLVGPPGIWKPRIMQLPLSITTTAGGPYEDSDINSGFFEYRYQGQDRNNGYNTGLRRIMELGLPLIYFNSTIPSRYQTFFSVFIVRDEPNRLTFTAQVDQLDIIINPDRVEEKNETFWRRKYATVNAQVRLHQQKFRERVLYAYNNQCSLCRLRHPELLDAAHIIDDKEEKGDPIVPNGLSLCKIHHAAFDRQIIGITPNYEIKIRQDILEEIDGPMLKFGLQSLNNGELKLPNKRKDYPDKERLDYRYSLFLKAG